ncbi:MAG: hypothetical protein ACLPY5_04265 [Candidatus Bathyarchaeia archaeon]
MKKVSYLVVFVIIAITTLLSTGSGFAHTQTARNSQPTQYGGSGYLFGQVLGFDQYNYLVPISWAKVIATNGISAFAAATGGDGSYGMYLPAGYYNVTAIEPGFVPHTIFVAVSDGSSSSINFYLEQSHIPVPEFRPQMILIVMVVALTATLLAKRARKRTK